MSIKNHRKLRAAALAASLFGMIPGYAQNPYDWGVQNARVTSIELTYMPGELQFYIDLNAGGCATGSKLVWRGRGADEVSRQNNMKAVLAALIASKTTGTSLQLYGKNAGCEVIFFYFG